MEHSTYPTKHATDGRMSHDFPNLNTYREMDTATEVRTPAPGTVDARYVMVHVRPIRGFVRWEEPPTRTVRQQVDKALKGTGYRRDGKRTMVRSSLGWTYRYPVTRD